MKFSSIELKELAISAVVIGFSFAWIMRTRNTNFVTLFLVMMISVGSAFILHELAHKLVAQHYGCWAEYRMWETGLILAFFLAVTVRMIFAAPGAVYITSHHGISRRENGIISVAGPVTNLVLALLFLPLRGLDGALEMLGNFGFIINSWLALFNMLPFGPLDGSKVKAWNTQVWMAIAIIAFFFLSR